ncbi:hypothetical protein [Microbispora rosea]|uniref:hypothetical protein n=1 Tax=Microbispora rosea TaxID=58117 RepID=UPI003F4DAEBE
MDWVELDPNEQAAPAEPVVPSGGRADGPRPGGLDPVGTSHIEWHRSQVFRTPARQG